MNEFDLITGYIPGLIGRIAELHAKYYSKNWNFGQYFEIQVATKLSDFILNYDEEKECIFSLFIDGKVEGSISICRSEEDNAAHLRWFIISDKLRGTGAGNYLLSQVMTFLEKRNYNKVFLWTFKGLTSARHLYEKYGFKLTEERIGIQWGPVITEQRLEAEIKTAL